MGLLNWLGITKDIPDTINAISNLYTTDKEKLEGEQKLEETQQKPDLQQLEINKILASSGNLYLNGWQPLLGWTCGACVALYWIPQVTLGAYIWIKLSLAQNKILPFPIDITEMLKLLALVLGYRFFGTKRIE
jgi:hypothetical protein